MNELTNTELAESVYKRIAELEADCAMLAKREKIFAKQLADAQSALCIAFDYMMDKLTEDRQRYAGYKPKEFEQWAKDEAQVRVALGMESCSNP